MQEEILRYSKQIILNNVGLEGQEKLKTSKVLVVGAGGLGCPALTNLAYSGVGTLGICDFDTVTLSNLNRQTLYTENDLGKKKTTVAKEKLLKINKNLIINEHPKRLDIENIEAVIKDYDIVLDCTDNITARYLISDCCFFLKKPLIEGAAVGYEGFLMSILPNGFSPCYRCLYPFPPKDGMIKSCNDNGILGAIVGTIGTLQALEAIKVLLGISNNSGKALLFDGFNLTFDEIVIKKDDHCPLCGKNPSVKELEEYHIKCKERF